MKVAELRSQGWKAIQGDVLTNGLTARIVLSEGGAIAVNEWYHDELEVVELLWRDKTSEDLGFHGNAEYSLDGWRPYFGPLSNADKPTIAIDEEPVFTQAMADNGELPPVGSESQIMLDGYWQNCFMVGFSKSGNPVIQMGVHCIESIGCDYKPLDTRTEKQKAIYAAITEWPVADKATLELAYDLWATKPDME